jgi:hypothetical protein
MFVLLIKLELQSVSLSEKHQLVIISHTCCLAPSLQNENIKLKLGAAADRSSLNLVVGLSVCLSCVAGWLRS